MKPLTASLNMANLKRSAKRVSQWINNEILTFNIRVEDAGVEAFFNIPQLPSPTVSTTILDNLDEPMLPEALPKNDHQFFEYECLAEKPLSIIDFPMFLLKLLGYENRHHLLGIWAKDPLLMAGRRIIAMTDLYLMSVDDPLYEVYLVVHENKVSCLTGIFLRLTVLSSALKSKSRSTSHREGNRRLRPQ